MCAGCEVITGLIMEIAYSGIYMYHLGISICWQTAALHGVAHCTVITRAAVISSAIVVYPM